MRWKDHTMGNHLRNSTGTPGRYTRPQMIELHKLTVVVQNQAVLHEITLEMSEGESVALIGSSTAEKQALLACLLGQLQPTTGQIRLLDTSLPPLPPKIRRQLGVTPQQVEQRVGETVALYLQRFSAYHGVQLTYAQVSLYCTHYGLPPSAQVTELNPLQTRVLALALALAHDPRLALLIEPLTGLTVADRPVMQEYLRRAQCEGRTLLCTFTPPLAETDVTGYDLVVKLEQGRLFHLKR